MTASIGYGQYSEHVLELGSKYVGQPATRVTYAVTPLPEADVFLTVSIQRCLNNRTALEVCHERQLDDICWGKKLKPL